MQVLIDVVTVAGFAVWVWWLLSTRTALKAIQRKLGADPKWEAARQGGLYHTEQAVPRQRPGPQQAG